MSSSINQEIENQILRINDATTKAAEAYERLLHLAETRESGQIPRIAQFIAATYNGNVFKFDLFDLRGVDEAISTDMLYCLDGLRFGRSDLYKLVHNGDDRVKSVIKAWGIK